MGGLSRKRK